VTTKNIIAVMLGVILLIGSLVGYGIYVNVSGNAHADKLAAAQYSRVNGAKVAYRDIAPVLEVPTLYLQSSWMLDVHVKLDGTITRLYVNPGDQVKAGQLLGEIVNDELPSQVLQAEGKINEARANFVKYTNTLNRFKALVDNGGVSKMQLDEAIANQAAGEAVVMSAEAARDQLASRLSGQKIIAPRDGDILKVYSKVGAFIRTGEAMVMIGDFSSLQARENMRHEILEKLLPLDSRFKLVLSENQTVSKAYAANYRQEKFSAEQSFDIRLDQVNPPMDVSARYRSVVWQVENPGGVLEPGTYYRAKIYGTTARRVLAMPIKAVSGITDQRVFLVSSDNRLMEGRVRTGVRDDEYIEILDGLKEGDVVVLTGREGLVPGSSVQVILEASPEKQ
jgi:RND family efflux transporter MFP subunit